MNQYICNMAGKADGGAYLDPSRPGCNDNCTHLKPHDCSCTSLGRCSHNSTETRCVKVKGQK